jgi:hypothetical protein
MSSRACIANVKGIGETAKQNNRLDGFQLISMRRHLVILSQTRYRGEIYGVTCDTTH